MVSVCNEPASASCMAWVTLVHTVRRRFLAAVLAMVSHGSVVTGRDRGYSEVRCASNPSGAALALAR